MIEKNEIASATFEVMNTHMHTSRYNKYSVDCQHLQVCGFKETANEESLCVLKMQSSVLC
jgi:hypothetical protein